jgi:hypothetical protein
MLHVIPSVRTPGYVVAVQPEIKPVPGIPPAASCRELRLHWLATDATSAGHRWHEQNTLTCTLFRVLRSPVNLVTHATMGTHAVMSVNRSNNKIVHIHIQHIAYNTLPHKLYSLLMMIAPVTCCAGTMFGSLAGGAPGQAAHELVDAL